MWSSVVPNLTNDCVANATNAANYIKKTLTDIFRIILISYKLYLAFIYK